MDMFDATPLDTQESTTLTSDENKENFFETTESQHDHLKCRVIPDGNKIKLISDAIPTTFKRPPLDTQRSTTLISGENKENICESREHQRHEDDVKFSLNPGGNKRKLTLSDVIPASCKRARLDTQRSTTLISGENTENKENVCESRKRQHHEDDVKNSLNPGGNKRKLTPATFKRPRLETCSECLCVKRQCDEKLSTQNHEIVSLSKEIDQLKKQLKKAKTDLNRTKRVSQNRLRTIWRLRKRDQRNLVKLNNLKDVIDHLSETNKINEDEKIILSSLGVSNEVLVRRMLDKSCGKSLNKEYTPELKKFAVTLNFLSPRAYDYIRQQFNFVLPHPRTISSWYQNIDASPGFIKESIHTIKNKVQLSDKRIYASLSFDEMAIRKMVEWNGNKCHGFIDFGQNQTEPSDDLPLAKEAFVFMVTAVNDSWKIPVGYFFVNGLTGSQKANLVKKCLSLLNDTGIEIISLTFDGASNNKSMCTELGCSLNTSNLNTVFEHDEKQIVVMFDPCHNLKLVRNTFGECGDMVDNDGGIISWSFIDLLHNLQNNEGLHLGNKLSTQHINFLKQKMKVRLAAQLLSRSVADALDFCIELELPEFSESKATSKFLRIFNDLFDIMNARNIRALGYKKPLGKFNAQPVLDKLAECEAYIKQLKFPDGTLLINSPRKTGFVGFLVCIESLRHLYYRLIMTDSLKYLLTYKLNQDHLGLFFGSIRSRCGNNNNPSARMFQASFKRLLVHFQMTEKKTGNCLPLESINILNCKSSKRNFTESINASDCKSRMTDLVTDYTSPVDGMEDHNYILGNHHELSEYADHVVMYIAGFVVRKIKKQITCEQCLLYLESDVHFSSLIQKKNVGGLIFPSQSVVKICSVAERHLKICLHSCSNKAFGCSNKRISLLNQIFTEVSKNKTILNTFSEHSLDQEFENNHMIFWVKSIAECYINVRIHHIVKQENEKPQKLRMHLNKTILFMGQ